MDTDVLIVGAGPTGLMLANQLCRRGVRVRSSSTGMRGRRCRRERWACRRARSRSMRTSASSIARWNWASAGPAQISGRKAGRWRASLWGRPGETSRPIRTFSSLARTTTNGSWATGFAIGGKSVQWNTELVGLEQAARPCRGNAQTARRDIPNDRRRLGRRMRRRAQRRARALRHHVSGRALRACVLRRRHGSDREHGPRRSQRLPLAEGLSPALSDARERSLAHCRHPAPVVAAAATMRRSRRSSLRCARKQEPVCRSRRAPGSPPTASITAALRTFATAAASCSATRRTFTALSAPRA